MFYIKVTIFYIKIIFILYFKGKRQKIYPNKHLILQGLQEFCIATKLKIYLKPIYLCICRHKKFSELNYHLIQFFFLKKIVISWFNKIWVYWTRGTILEDYDYKYYYYYYLIGKAFK